MELSEAIRLLRAVAPNLVFERPHAEAFRVVLAEAERIGRLAAERDAATLDGRTDDGRGDGRDG